MANEVVVPLAPYAQPNPHVNPMLAEITEVPIEKFRRSFYQGAEVLGGYFADTGDRLGGLNWSFEEARVSFGLPLGSMDNILGMRPYFRALHLDGPTDVDVPSTVYDTGVTFLNQRTWTPRVSTTLVVSPAVRSDFTTDNQAFRIFGLGLVNYQCRETLKLSAGAVFLDREDVGVLPAFGFVWTPTPQWQFDGMIPRPRIARRLWKDGGEAEGWAFIGASFGGNTFAVTRDDNRTDLLTLRDYRVMGGYEVIRSGNRGAYVEAGYSFGRSLEYDNDNLDFDLDDAVFVQASWQF
ncbi:hypothetical protein Pla22_16880 [Rubripirellula amarantea]|uniref:DUF6268 domain-containing protein n=1 Tax=Rubripirellula amarantea TaxID=2527999 RepID=A0A5C5WVI7_9BACT|nr:hypothetical protein [Rubripirellula amarantea]TWT54053.1 hypothetical protein Pla22_16880 [Rubripirellula amarantea]